MDFTNDYLYLKDSQKFLELKEVLYDGVQYINEYIGFIYSEITLGRPFVYTNAKPDRPSDPSKTSSDIYKKLQPLIEDYDKNNFASIKQLIKIPKIKWNEYKVYLDIYKFGEKERVEKQKHSSFTCLINGSL